MLTAPWISVLVHATLLAVTSVALFRIARRALPAPVAAAVAVFPVASEPSRVLLGWPSGGEYLIAIAAAAWAVHEALNDRPFTAGAASLVAALSHESSLLLVPMLPAIAWATGRRGRAIWPWLGISVGLVTVMAAGHAAASHRGMQLPPGLDSGAVSRLGEAIGRALTAALNLEEPSRFRPLARVSYAAIAFVAVAVFATPAARARLRALVPALAFGAVWFAAGVPAMAALLPDWNGWRTVFPGLGLALVVNATLGAASGWLAIAFTAVRVGLLAMTPPADAIVAVHPPDTASRFSFARLVRLQRTLESTRRALLERYPTLPHGGRVAYWMIPALVEMGFEGPRAVRVWYQDPNLQWDAFTGAAGLADPPDALIEYSSDRSAPATVIEPEAMRLFAAGLDAERDGRLEAADSLLRSAMAAQRRMSAPLGASLAYNRARVDAAIGWLGRADSLADLDEAWAGESSRVHEVRAMIAVARGDPRTADAELRRCLTLQPDNSPCRNLAYRLGLIRAP
jgi:hypothetical protein